VDRLFAATEQGLAVSQDGGESWQPDPSLRQPVSMVETTADGAVYAFMLGSGLMRAEEPSLDWQALSNGFGDRYLLHLAVDPYESRSLLRVHAAQRNVGKPRRRPHVAGNRCAHEQARYRSAAVGTLTDLAAYAGLFVSAFTSATLLPGSSEAALIALLALGRGDAGLLVVVATAGNVLGSCVNWVLGRFFSSFATDAGFRSTNGPTSVPPPGSAAMASGRCCCRGCRSSGTRSPPSPGRCASISCGS
jgi:hypothetical protein